MMIPLDNSIHSVRSESSSIGRSIRSNTNVIDSEQDRKKREQKRRKYELKLIKKFDSTTIDPRKDCWFLVDCRWLDAWAEYVQYIPPKREDEGESSDNTDGDRSVSSPLDVAESELRNSEPELEPALPGPISTRDLLSADGKTPLPNLTAKVDYRGVPSMVYSIFVELYGKDSFPEICRYLVDIYKAPVPEDKLVKIKLNAVPRAAIEVNKIRPKWIKWEIDSPEVDEEDELWEEKCCCCCVPCFKGLRKEHIEAFIYWAIVCWTNCCMGGRRRHGRGDISYSKYTPLRTPAEDQSTVGGGGGEDGAGSRSRSSSISSSRSRVSNKSSASRKSNKSHQSVKSDKSSKSGGSRAGGSQRDSSSSDSGEESSDEFHAGPADRNEDQRVWVRSLLWR